MREPELLLMSQKERDRLKVLHEVEKGHGTQRQAAAPLGLTERWVRKLLGRVRREGDGGIMRRARGRPSNRKLPAAWRERAVARVKDSYRDFGPTLAMEYLAKRDRIAVSKETLRQWLIAAEVWKARPRRACRGERVQWDTSEQAWLEGRGGERRNSSCRGGPLPRRSLRFGKTHDFQIIDNRQLSSFVQFLHKAKNSLVFNNLLALCNFCTKLKTPLFSIWF